ncbi:MAG: AAA family ATPase, partial [Acidimicrobiales bacterium]
AAVAGFDEHTRTEAAGRLGIRLSITGKGGAGKTFISSVVARTLAQRGRQVLAVDLDTCPGLSISLGIGSGDEGALPLEALEENPGASYGWQLGHSYTPRQVVENFAVEGPDGVRFLSLGKIASEDKTAAKRSVVALVQLLLGFGDAEWDVVADMEAGPTTPFERYHSFSDLMLVVYGPAWRSAMTAHRLLTVVGPRGGELIANRFRDEMERPGLSPLARIPADPEVAEAERLGLAPMDACPDAPAVVAVRRLTETHLLDRNLNQPKEAVSP